MEEKQKVCNTPECIHKGILQPLSNFYPRPDKPNGYYGRCKDCERLRRRNYYEKNSENEKKKKNEYDRKNVEKNKDYRKRTKEQRKEYEQKYYKENKFKYFFHSALRRARKKQATPKWADLNKIREIYKDRDILEKQDGIARDIHHIIPFKTTDQNGKHVACGLHVPNNLQIIFADVHTPTIHRFEYILEHVL